MISLISLVICACRARLYFSDSALIISPAFSVAAFMATRRAICSLTRGVEEALEEPNLERHRQDLFQDLRGAGQEFVFDACANRPLTCRRC